MLENIKAYVNIKIKNKIDVLPLLFWGRNVVRNIKSVIFVWLFTSYVT